MDDNNPEYHFNLGLVHEQMNSYSEAIDEYRRAGTCDPSNPMYELAVGGVYASNGALDQALPILEGVYAKHPQDSTANYYLGMVLVELAEEVPATKDANSYVVKSEDEIKQMRVLAERAKGLNIVDEDVRTNADRILSYLTDMETMTFRPPWSWIMSGAAVGSGAGVGGAVAGGCLTIGIFLAPLFFILAGFGQMGSNFGGGFVLLLIGAGLSWLWWKLMYVPKWKHAKRDL